MNLEIFYFIEGVILEGKEFRLKKGFQFCHCPNDILWRIDLVGTQNVEILIYRNISVMLQKEA